MVTRNLYGRKIITTDAKEITSANVVAEVEKLRLKSAKYGQIIIKNVLDTGADVIVTAND